MSTGVGVFVGRRAELDRLERALTRSRRDAPDLVAVTGEAGIGKTRLLAELVQRAEERRWLVLEGRASEYERDLPFAPLVDAIGDYIASLSSGRLAELGAERLSRLAGIFPAIAAEPAGGAGDDDPDRFHTYAAFRALLQQLARAQPLLLVLDDLHWADDSSIELVSYLLRHPPRELVLIAVALRPAQAAAPLLAALAQAQRDGRAEHVELPPLTEREAQELLADLDPETRGEIYRDSGGNPFYLEELLRAAGRERGDEVGGGRRPRLGVPVPESVRKALLDELAGLSSEVRGLASGAAVAGDPFDLDLAAAAAGVPRDEALVRIDELLEHELVRPTEVPRQFRFRHPIVRRAIYDSAQPGWRLAAHERAAAALAERGADSVARAHHVEQSAQPGDESAIAILGEAAQAVALRAPAASARWYAAVLRLLPATPEALPQRLMLLVARATALGSAGRLAEARAAVGEALEAAPPSELALRIQLVAFAAFLDHLLGRHDEATKLLEATRADVTDPSSPEAAALRLELAIDAFFHGDYSAMEHRAEEALAAATSLGVHPLHAAAAALAAWGKYNPGRAEEADAFRRDAAALVDELPDEALAARLDALLYLGYVEVHLGYLDAALTHLQRGLDLSRATQQPYLLPPLRVLQAMALLDSGNPTDAAASAEAAYEGALLLANDQYQAMALDLRSLVALAEGDAQAAVEFARQAIEPAQRSGEMVIGFTSLHLGEALLEVGRPAEARDAFLAQVGPELGPIELAAQPWACEFLVRAELALGHADTAAEWAERGERIAAGTALARPRLYASKARAAVELARGNPARTLEAAAAAVETAERAGLAIEAAIARILVGQARAALGDRERAIAELEYAQRELAMHGARRHHDRAARELRKLGRRVPTPLGRRGEENGVLTPRQREIAELVAAGKTNRQIASELFISEKTVETHLANIFEKLGVSSRSAIGAILERSRSES